MTKANKHVDFTDTYSTQRTCLNGHVVNDEADEDLIEQPFCHHCGVVTITKCPNCNGPLKGARKYRPAVLPKADAYCLHCGKALPWTESHLEALQESAKLVSGLTDTDRVTLAEIMPDLVVSKATPRTQVSVLKMKQLLVKGGPAFMATAKDILVEVVSSTIAKSLFG